MAPNPWAGRQAHIFALFANEHFVGVELEFLRQPHGLAAIAHEHLSPSLHGRMPPEIPAPYTYVYAILALPVHWHAPLLACQ
jgi:hypothetical protein